VTIPTRSGDPARPYANLLPLVETLIAAGNELVDDGFLMNPDGWRCRLRQPLDLQLVREKFNLPENIQLSEEFDSVLDRSSWCVIEGPGSGH